MGSPGTTAGGLLTAEVRRWLGFTVRFGPETVVARDVLRYLVATGAPLPGPAEPDLPRVPPLFYRTFGRPIVTLDRLEDDGRWPDLRPPVGVGQVMVGGIEVDFLRELRVGDVVTGERTLATLVEKHGRRRRFVLATWRTVLRDVAGDEVVRETVDEIMY